MGHELMGEYLSTQETAELLGIDYSTARRWLRAGKLPSDKIANRIFGRKAEIECKANELRGTISIEETAILIDRAPRTVNHLIIVDKKITAIKWMRRWFVFKDSVEKYLKDREDREAKNV